MDRRRPPDTAAGYAVGHDFRRIDWTAWRTLDDEAREAAVDEAESFLHAAADVEGGGLGCASVMGHRADMLLVVLREDIAALDAFERQFNRLALADVTERTHSAIGVTEASGYTPAARAYFDDDREADPGIRRYLETRLRPDLPDAEFVVYYPMSKRRDPDQNWYDLPYAERADHVARHGEIGKEYAGRVTQLITGTIGFTDWEWGVTLFANDMVAVKDLLTDMRYDPSTSKYAEFGPFFVGRQFPPADLEAFLAGEAIPTEREPSTDDAGLGARLADLEVDVPADAHAVLVETDADPGAVEAALDELRDQFDHYDSHRRTLVADDGTVVSAWATNRAAETASGFLAELPGASSVTVGTVEDGGDPEPVSTGDAEAVRDAIAAADVYAGTPHGEDVHALVVYSDDEELGDRVADLAAGFDRYDTHRGTDVYAATTDDLRAVVSLWETASAAETAASYLADLPAVRERMREDDGFATMGMFYRVKPDHREDFRETFAAVRDALAEFDGHRETELFVNDEDVNDMFIASHWRDRDAATAFFRSDAFRETVEWGRDVLADRPRHVFLV